MKTFLFLALIAVATANTAEARGPRRGPIRRQRQVVVVQQPRLLIVVPQQPRPRPRVGPIRRFLRAF